MKRPTFLTVWLILMAIAGVFSLYSYTLGISSITRVFPNIPPWVFFTYNILAVVQLISVVLLWNWKRIGFYLIAAIAIIVAVLNGITLGAFGISSAILGLIGVGILYLAMRRDIKQSTPTSPPTTTTIQIVMCYPFLQYIPVIHYKYRVNYVLHIRHLCILITRIFVLNASKITISR
jgi:hypothetical protein